jgi:hypothetical protein
MEVENIEEISEVLNTDPWKLGVVGREWALQQDAQFWDALRLPK